MAVRDRGIHGAAAPVGPYRAPIVVGVVTSQLVTLPAIVLLLGVGVINAWVLLIEILR